MRSQSGAKSLHTAGRPVGGLPGAGESVSPVISHRLVRVFPASHPSPHPASGVTGRTGTPTLQERSLLGEPVSQLTQLKQAGDGGGAAAVPVFHLLPCFYGVEAAHRQFTQMIPTHTQTGLTSLVNWSMEG